MLRLIGSVFVRFAFCLVSPASPDATIGGFDAPGQGISSIFAFRLQNRDLRFTSVRAPLPICNVVRKVVTSDV